MATDFVLMNRRTFGIRTAALCFAAGMMVSPFSLAAEEPLLKIGVLPAADSVLLYAAESEGFFESRGLRIQLLPFKSAIEIGAAMRAGELAGHYGDLINVFTQNAAGAPQAVAATVTYANPAERNFALVTRPGSNLTSLEDIKTHPGTDTAMSASTIIDYLLDRMEATTGLPPSAMKRVEVRQIPIRLQLLLAGKMETAAEHFGMTVRSLSRSRWLPSARPPSRRKRQPPSARRSPMRLRPLKAIRKSSVP